MPFIPPYQWEGFDLQDASPLSQQKVRRRRPPGNKRIPADAHVGPPGDPRKCLWTPPASPHSLIEEQVYNDPWKLLLVCMLLNKTAGRQVRRVTEMNQERKKQIVEMQVFSVMHQAMFPGCQRTTRGPVSQNLVLLRGILTEACPRKFAIDDFWLSHM